MTELFLALGIPLGYFMVAGGVYRTQYIRVFKQWRRWQAESPEEKTNVGDEPWMTLELARKRVSLWQYVWRVQNSHTPPSLLGMFWPILGVCFGLKKVLQPKVQVPDYTKIEELENGDV